MGRRLVILTTLALLALAAWAFYALARTASRGGTSLPVYSARRCDPYGTAALLELLDEMGVPVRTLERPRLEPDDRGVLIQVVPLVAGSEEIPEFLRPRRPRFRLEDLSNWVAQGNTVVQFTRAQTGLMDALGFAPDPQGSTALRAAAIQESQERGVPPNKLAGTPIEARWTEAGHALVGRDAKGLVLLEPRDLRQDAAKTGARVLASAGAVAVAVEVPCGKGQLIVVGAPTPALNNGLLMGGNLEFILALVGDDPVIFDEWTHGIGHGGTVIELLRKFGLYPVLVQVLAVLGLYVWSTRGHPRADDGEPERRRSIAEQVDALGHLYNLALPPRAVVLRVQREVIRRLTAALRCTPEALATGKLKLEPDDATRLRDIKALMDSLATAGEPRRLPAALAKLLTLTHQFTKETSHGRRPA